MYTVIYAVHELNDLKNIFAVDPDTDPDPDPDPEGKNEKKISFIF